MTDQLDNEPRDDVDSAQTGNSENPTEPFEPVSEEREEVAEEETEVFEDSPEDFGGPNGVEDEAQHGESESGPTEEEDKTETFPVINPETSPEEHEPEHAAKKPSGARIFWYGFAGAAVACIIVFGIAGAISLVSADEDDTTVAEETEALTTDSVSSDTLGATSSSTTIEVTGDDLTIAEVVAAKCLPSIAYVSTYIDSSSLSSMYGYDYSYGYDYGYDEYSDNGLTLYGSGSGVALTSDGYIITNNHVIEGGDAFTVTIDGVTYDADLVGTDASSDVAVLKAEDATLTPIEIGDSDDLEVGEWVMTLGCPFGLDQSVATGIISATNRSQILSASEYGTDSDTLYPNMIQTDAAINPGNSGGALVDSQGRLIGINTLITSYSGNYSGVGFAIPVNYAIGIAEQIMNGETPSHAQLGVSLSAVTSSIAQMYGLSSDEGAYVASVSSDSAAAEAGIEVGDVIIGFNGETVTSPSDLMLDVRGQQIGSTVTLTINRDGEEFDVDVVLGSDANSSTSTNENESEDYGNSYDYGYGYGYDYGYPYGYDYGYGYGDDYGYDYDYDYGYGYGY
ncbi:MAG: trypsin-like peptidase domain-containing protein [Eggerthellaceae bacterium]|nr:trypsin-like peptidase domain-containing protein [Eggerthellaceae bacterium]